MINPDPVAIGANPERPQIVRAKGHDPAVFETAQDAGGRVPVAVVASGADQRRLRLDRIEERFGGRGTASMVAQLEDFDIPRQVQIDQRTLAGCFQIAGEQDLHVEIIERHDQRGVVVGRAGDGPSSRTRTGSNPPSVAPLAARSRFT